MALKYQSYPKQMPTEYAWYLCCFDNVSLPHWCLWVPKDVVPGKEAHWSSTTSNTIGDDWGEHITHFLHENVVKRDQRRFWYHPESDSYLMTATDKEAEDMLHSGDGGLCGELTSEEYIESMKSTLLAYQITFPNIKSSVAPPIDFQDCQARLREIEKIEAAIAAAERAF